MGVCKAQLGLDLRRERRGGKRKNAGRKALGRRASERHKTRPRHVKRNPVHVVLRFDAALRDMRKRRVWRAVRVALVRTSHHPDFRVCHVSIQQSHVHLIVEANDKDALARGMKGFQVSAARWINRTLRRRGRVFADRYHPEYLTSPLQVRRALSYVLNNWRKHHEDVSSRTRLDPFSSALTFGGWDDAEPLLMLTPGLELLPVKLPKTWLLGVGWQRHGLVSPWETPGPR